jgi:uncharacterized secreted protein with C-terminal beta-propeller domain
MRKLTGLLVALMLTGLVPVLPAVAAGGTGPFNDVAGDYINATAIDYLKTAGVISGYPDGSYMPQNEINRAEFTKIVVGAIYTDVKGSNCFPDVKEDWYAPYVCTAKEKGIIEGYPDGNFKPDAKIKFSEASKIIANTLGGGVDPNALLSSSGQWYQPYVMSLESRKDIPLSVEFFDENVTRDEMAEMIYRLKANVTTKATRTYKEIEGDGLVMVDSCAALKARFEEQNQYQYYMYNAREGLGGAVEEALPAPVSAPTSADAVKSEAAYTGGGGSADYSTTNIQVEGVDEADVVKNDGRYIYLIRGNSLRIVDAYPATNLKEIVSFILGEENESFYPVEMYVDGDTLTVIGSVSRYYPEPILYDTTEKVAAESIYPYFGYNRTKVYVLNISDRAAPKVERAVEYDASYTSSRKVDDTLYMVMNQYMYYSPYYYDTYPTMKAAEPADAIVPKMLDTAEGEERLIAPCDDIYILPKAPNFNYLITSAVPLADTEKTVKSSVLVGDTGNIYASKNNLYVAATDWGGGYYREYSDYGTMVYRFALADASIAYKNAGKVPGTVLNQFSMDESNGYFRIATSKDQWTPGVAQSTGVYVLNSAMDTVGKIEKIAPGEKMYSARFMGNTAYLVTFKSVDPFFVLDLSDPKNPVIEGKLKIPGYSTYLQPYDENHVLGFGYDVDASKIPEDSEWLPWDAQLGMKISMFDTTDLDHPIELYKEVIGDRGTYSEVLYNHKALLFDKEKNLMALPVTVYEIPDTDMCSEKTYSSCPSSCQKTCVPSSCSTQNGIKICTADCDGAGSCKAWDTTYGKPVFDGAYVYTVTLDKGFTLKGKVSHYNETDMNNLMVNGYTDYNKTIQRALYIGEYLYTISPSVIKANLLSDLSEKKMIELAGELWNIYYGGAVQ